MIATDLAGNQFKIGSFKIAAGLTTDSSHNLYVLKNGVLLGWIDVADQIRPEAQEVINYLHKKKLKTN